MSNKLYSNIHDAYIEQSAIEADSLVNYPCEKESRDAKYFLKCTYFWAEFKETPSFPYCENHICDWQEALDVNTQEEADIAAERLNKMGFICPKCGKKGKLKGATQFEIFNDMRILENINKTEINHG